MTARASGSNVATPPPWLSDGLASVVTFVVALPLCIGIAVACGVPAERGLVTGILGGIVVGLLSGAPLLVSGPAASLIVPVFDVVQNHGLVALGPIVVLAGVWQMLAGVLRLGQWFRAVAPAVIKGMLIGIGILIFASQLHVAVGGDPRGSFTENLRAFPGALALVGTSSRVAASAVAGGSTIAILVAWNRFRPKRLSLVPGHLVSLILVTATVVGFGIPVRNLDISPRFIDSLTVASLGDFAVLSDPSFIGLSFMFAFVASAATLLTASAIDQRQTFVRTDYDREMFAQGVGNMLAGGVGGLPMTGVIVRSSVNVDAGARTRLSTILHGVWILVFVVVAPEVLERIPRATLGAILVYTGFKLIDINGLTELYRRSRGELVIALLTLFGVVFIELFVGILLGLAAAIAKIVLTFTRLDIRSEPESDGRTHHLHLTGSATFLQLPRLATALDAVPADRELHLHIEGLVHIDHACLELLGSWERRREGAEGPGLVVEWDELTSRYRHARFGGREKSDESSASLLGALWNEWKRTYSTLARGHAGPALRADWIDVSRIRLKLDAESLDDVLVAAADMLAPAADCSAATVLDALRVRAAGGNVALGDGVSLPHAALPGLADPLAAIVTTHRTIDLSGDATDLFFVLLAPESDPRRHLVSLAHVGRLCHQPEVLSGLRIMESPEAALNMLSRADSALSERTAPLSADDRTEGLLVVLEVDREHKLLRDLVEEAFGAPASLSERDGVVFESLRRVLILSPHRRLLVLAVERHELDLLAQLLAEFTRLVGPGSVRARLLRGEGFDVVEG